MMLSNNKLLDRGAGIVMRELGVDHATAQRLLSQTKSVRGAIELGRGLAENA